MLYFIAISDSWKHKEIYVYSQFILFNVKDKYEAQEFGNTRQFLLFYVLYYCLYVRQRCFVRGQVHVSVTKTAGS